MSDPNDHSDIILNRRRFLAGTALTAGALALPTAAFAVEDEFAATSGESVYFRGWQYKPDVVQDNVDRYNKLHSGKVDYQTVTGDYPALMEKSLIAGDKLDMIYANPPTAVRFYEAGWIKPADELISGPAAMADMYDKVRQAWTHKGKLLGLSYFLTTRGVIAVNRQKQTELGVADADMPKTWDEFYAHLDALAAKGGKDLYLPHWFNEFYGISWAFLWEVINRGGTTVDPKTRAPTVAVDNAAGKTLAAWKKLWNAKLVPEEVLTYTEANVVDGFASGRYLYSPQAAYNLAYFNDKEKSKIAGNVGFIPYRGQAWGLLDSALYLTTTRKRSPALDADVNKFVSYYGYKDTRGKVWVGQGWMENSMLFSGYKSVMESSETKEALKGFLARESDVKELLDLYAQTDAPNDVWQVVWAEELNSWLRKRLADFLLNDQSVETVIGEMSAQIVSLNKKYKI
jgi:ABC-type glycerol-3-phosphate transport system substrate-binding protein